MLVVVGKDAEAEEIRDGLGGEPLAHVCGGMFARARLPALEPRERIARLALEHEQVVAARLDLHQQAVERGDVETGRSEATLERLNERRARAGERVEYPTSRRDMPPEEFLDELRDELPEVRVETMDVFRPLPLWKLALGPREIEVERGVERVLRCRHAVSFGGGRGFPIRLEGGADTLEPTCAFGDDVEPNGEARVFLVRSEPGFRGAPEPPDLLLADHLERVAETATALGLHLAEDYGATAAHHEVELVPADPDVRPEHPVARARDTSAMRAAPRCS